MWVLAGGLLLLLALLAVPVRLVLVADTTAAPRLSVHASWLFGLVHGELNNSDRKEPERTPDRPKKKRSGTGTSGMRRAWAFAQAAGGLDRLRRLLGDLINSLHPRVDSLHIELGLGDPADTGRAWALLGPLSVLVAQRYGGRVALQPDFMRQTLGIEGRAKLTLIPLQALGVLLSYALSPSTRRGLHAAYRA